MRGVVVLIVSDRHCMAGIVVLVLVCHIGACSCLLRLACSGIVVVADIEGGCSLWLWDKIQEQEGRGTKHEG